MHSIYKVNKAATSESPLFCCLYLHATFTASGVKSLEAHISFNDTAAFMLSWSLCANF